MSGGCKQACQFDKLVCVSDRCIRSHFPPFGLGGEHLRPPDADLVVGCLPCRYVLWDLPGTLTECPRVVFTPGVVGIQSSRAQVEAHYSEPQQTARFLAAATPHSGDWLLALSISSCGLRLSDDAVRVAVALRLGCSICVTHACRCGSPVDTHGLHGFVCKQAPGRITRHCVINDVMAWSLTTTGVQVTKEPCWLTRTDGRRPDGLPWLLGKPGSRWLGTSWYSAHWQTRMATCHLKSAGGAAEAAASRKTSKYADLPATRIFQPLAFETHGTTRSSAIDFLNAVGGQSTSVTGGRRTRHVFSLAVHFCCITAI